MEDQIIDPFQDGTLSGMDTLSECLTHTEKHGYRESFEVRDMQLFAPSVDRLYAPHDVHVVNFYRFEGASNPDDMSILYVIKTTDNLKGILIDAYGTYADSSINDFITKVHDFHKREK